MPELRLDTERLVLREWREADRAPFADMNADPKVMRYYPATLSRDRSDAFIDRIGEHFDRHGLGLFALEDKASGVFIGYTGFLTVEVESPIKHELEIGWRLAAAFWRRGLAYEAASACLAWIGSAGDSRRVVSMTPAVNRPSRGLMEKLGLTHRPELDFDHPKITPPSLLVRHEVYARDLAA